jgi:hypothetical protein
MTWDVHPEPGDADELAALIAAAKEAFAQPNESAWWRSGLEDLGGSAAAERAESDVD